VYYKATCHGPVFESAISSCVQYPPWAFQQLGRPVGNPPYNLYGPPWLAGLGLRRWYTIWYIPNSIPRGTSRSPPSSAMLSFWRSPSAIARFLFCVWMAVLGVPPFFMSQSTIDSGLCDVVSTQRDFWDPLDLTTKSAVTFAT
jgi:hypothetical protein